MVAPLGRESRLERRERRPDRGRRAFASRSCGVASDPRRRGDRCTAGKEDRCDATRSTPAREQGGAARLPRAASSADGRVHSKCARRCSGRSARCGSGTADEEEMYHPRPPAPSAALVPRVTARAVRAFLRGATPRLRRGQALEAPIVHAPAALVRSGWRRRGIAPRDELVSTRHAAAGDGAVVGCPDRAKHAYFISPSGAPLQSETRA